MQIRTYDAHLCGPVLVDGTVTLTAVRRVRRRSVRLGGDGGALCYASAGAEPSHLVLRRGDGEPARIRLTDATAVALRLLGAVRAATTRVVTTRARRRGAP